MLKERVWFYLTSSFIKRVLLCVFLITSVSIILTNPIAPDIKQNLSFVSEQVDIRITQDNEVKVAGKYIFTIDRYVSLTRGFDPNNINYNPETIIYPIAQNYGDIEIDFISINKRTYYNKSVLIDSSLAKEEDSKLLKSSHMGKNKLLTNNDSNPNEIYIELDFSLSKSCELIIEYTHKAVNNKGKYILESTKSWNKPLEESIISITLPKGYVFHSNYLDLNKNLKTGQTNDLYIMKKTDFLPYHDLIFTWEEK